MAQLFLAKAFKTQFMIKKMLAAAAILVMLSGCGGGGSGGATGNGEGDDPVTPPGSGTISNPAVLSIETVYIGSVNLGASVYYSFTTGSRSLEYLTDLQSLTGFVSWTLYSDSSYSTYVSSCSQSSDGGDCNTSNSLNADTTYYLKLQNLATTNVSYTIRLDRMVSSEGSTSTPVQLTMGTTFEGTLGPKLFSSTVHSYYQFTTGASDSTYTINLSGASTDVRWKLYSGGWNDGVRDCDDVWAVGDESCATVSLTANTEYYLSVETQGPNSTFVNIDITTGGTHVNSLSDEGSVSTPVMITTETTQAGTISPAGTSYYQFTTASTTASYNMKLKHVSGALDFRIYSDSGFTNQVDAMVNYSSSTSFLDVSWYTVSLDADRTFYLKVENFANREDEFEIALYEGTPQDPDNEGTTISPVTLTPGVVHDGSAAGWGVSRYHFTADVAKPYQISLTSTQTDLSFSVGDDFSSIYGWSNCSTVTGVGDEICQFGPYDAGTEKLIEVFNNNENVTSTYQLLVEIVEGEGEGTQSSPVVITKGTPYLSSLAASGRSYYQFTTGAQAASYRITVSGASTDTEWSTRQLGELNDLMDCMDFSATPTTMICDTPVLTADTDYRVDVSNLEATRTDITVTVDNGTPIQAITLDAVAITHTADGYTQQGYFKFTTDSINTVYTLQATGSTNPVSLFIYPDDTYASYTKFCNTSDPVSENISCTVTGLTTNTTYFVRSYITKNAGVADGFDLAVLTGNYSESGVTLTLGADYLGKVGSNQVSYYQFTTAGGGPRVHDMTLTGQSESYIRLYDDALYTNQIDICYAASGTVACSTSATLSAGTTYYLSIDEIGGYAGDFTLNVTSQ